MVLILQGCSLVYSNDYCEQMAAKIGITTSSCEGKLHFVGRGGEGRLLAFPYGHIASIICIFVLLPII